MAELIWGTLPFWTSEFSGSGSGYGSGYGYGYGDGYGSGYGSGDGSGDGSGVVMVLAHIAQWPTAQQRRYNELSATGAVMALWKSTKEGRPANGGTAESVYVGLTQQAPGPLRLCRAGTLHATLNPSKWNGERLWVVALLGEVVWGGDKLGALKREIVGEVPMI